jgi:hypothetical protein
MRSNDFEICELATELVFNICIPASSMSNNAVDDCIDSMEVKNLIFFLLITKHSNLYL